MVLSVLTLNQTLALNHLAQAVAAFYGICAATVLIDAAAAAGAACPSHLMSRDQIKVAIDYLCGRLSLPDAPELPRLPEVVPR